ncbi:MAG: CRISPR-associated endonuclease Cas2 2 [candidate division WS2 bacterium]|nr:CRISPR-associated endonuclease Cas2 2 [Candidatus Lithacetigena glycinireducens]
MKKLYVIAYDIKDDGKRLEISNLLSRYGKRVNFSVFEFFLSKAEIKFIRNILRKKIARNKDRIIIYQLCWSCKGKIERLGYKQPKEGIVTIL